MSNPQEAADAGRALGLGSAFVIHVDPGALAARGEALGRIEHVRSGRTGTFRGLDDALGFMRDVLAGGEGGAGPGAESTDRRAPGAGSAVP